MHLISRGVLALSLLGNVEAEVLQQDDGSGGGVSAGGFHLRTHTVLQEGDIPAESQRTGEDACTVISYSLDRIKSVRSDTDGDNPEIIIPRNTDMIEYFHIKAVI